MKQYEYIISNLWGIHAHGTIEAPNKKQAMKLVNEIRIEEAISGKCSIREGKTNAGTKPGI
jgi:hypothetical protein